NNDGCLDLIVNTSDGTNRTRLFQNNCNYPNPTFTDVTASLAPQLLNNTLDRSAVWGDFNNDGYVDFARNVSWKIEVYQNQGPMGSPAWSFGQADHSPNYSATTLNGGFNTEGLAWVDYNGDGFLDLIVENHNYGIDILRNPADCSANFFHITPNSSSLGLPTWATDGDYMSTSDFNDDGWVDILARKKNQNDLWRNDGGTFSNIQNIDQATNGNKGSVLFADFDNDGDFDLFWTSNGTNQIWEQTGLNSGNYIATGEPSTSSGVALGTDIDACAAQDIDNDGDTDLVLVNNSGSGKVFINNSSGSAFSFTQNNNGFNVNGNGEGIVFGDYDNDGDQDLYVNKRNGNNQLWQNQTNNSNYLVVDPRLWLGGPFSRSDHGATAILYNADGSEIKGGIKDTRSSFGHGCQQGELIHFGLPDGPDVEYRLELKFTNIGGERFTKTVNITPAA
ncbi:MAG: FG-GAP repeat domain-containing protein, partial [Flavobacteriales bacterium]